MGNEQTRKTIKQQKNVEFANIGTTARVPWKYYKLTLQRVDYVNEGFLLACQDHRFEIIILEKTLHFATNNPVE